VVSDNGTVRRWFLRRKRIPHPAKFDGWLNKPRQAATDADPRQLFFQKCDMSIWLSFDEAANDVTAVLFRTHADGVAGEPRAVQNE
jgi:hypothetical protein